MILPSCFNKKTKAANSAKVARLSGNETVKRYILLILGLFFAGVGVAFTKKGELGVSPVSSAANVMSCKYDFLSLGGWLIIWNCILIVGQIIILRKNFKLIQLLQIPLSFLFGYFTDFGAWCISSIDANTYPIRLAFVIAGVIILGFGISLSVIANEIMNSGEAFVKAVSDSVNKDFGNIKILFDLCSVALAAVLSLILFDFKLVGIREGTVISAFCTGFVVKLFNKCLTVPLNSLLCGKH